MLYHHYINCYFKILCNWNLSSCNQWFCWHLQIHHV